jgi:GWxTD domain-containing protein
MKNKTATIIILLLSVFSLSFSQVENRKFEDIGVPKFFFDALGFTSTDSVSSRLDIYTQVLYEGVSFVKEGEIFTAKYELTIDIYDTKKNLIREKIINESIKTSNYDETVSSKTYKLNQQSFNLPPMKYVVSVQVRDNETNKPFRINREMELRNFTTRPLEASDIMILNKLTVEDSKKTIIPNISGNVAELNNAFHIFMEVYNRANIDSTQIILRLLDEKEKLVRTDTTYQPLKSGNNSVFVKVSTLNITMGSYQLKLSVASLRSEESLVEVSKKFNIQWKGMPHSFIDLDAAIDQMTYIFDQKEIDRIKKLPPSEKADAFKDLWKKKDPTPGTDRNELMEEYYSRVEYANKNFKHYLDGWRTDMGMVFIIFGSPNNVDRHPFDIDAKPFEVWYYYELNRQLVFVDETGFGDYHLTTPIWDVWQRPR